MQTICCLQQGGFKQPLPLLSHSNLDRVTKVLWKLGGKGAQPPPLPPGERSCTWAHTTLPSIPLLVYWGFWLQEHGGLSMVNKNLGINVINTAVCYIRKFLR